MTWLVWRQHRIEAALTAGLLALLGACLVAADAAMASAAKQVGLGNCLAHYTSASCGWKVSQFIQSLLSLTLTGSVMGLKALPALAGVFLGAPLVAREVERGTHRLAWTQSITRSGWLAGHMVSVLGIVLVASATTQLALNWFLSPLLDAGDLIGSSVARFGALMFDAIGIVPVAYTLFAVALGTTCGALTRRTLGAMVLVLVMFVCLRVSVALVARPHYQPVVTGTATTTHTPGSEPVGLHMPTGSWVLDVSYDQGDGRHGNFPMCSTQPAPVGPGSGTSSAMPGCVDRYTVTYQPGDRFWPFQLIESGIYLGLTVLLLGATWLLVLRRGA